MQRKRFFSFACVALVTIFSSISITSGTPKTFFKYQQELGKKISNIEDEICTTFSMSKIRWKLYKQSWKWGIRYRLNKLRLWYQFWGKSLSPQFKSIVSGLFKRLKIRFKVLNAKEYIDPNETDSAKKDPNLYYGASDGSCAYIDEETMKRHNISDAEVEGTVLHEVSHIDVGYNLAHFSLEKLIDASSGKVDSAKSQQLLRRFKHLHEEIADTLAALAGGLSTVNALIGTYQRSSSGASDTHPSSAARVAYLQRLRQDMQADSHYSGGNGYGRAFRSFL